MARTSLSPTQGFAEEFDSGVFPVSEQSVLVACETGDELKVLMQTLQQRGYKPIAGSAASTPETLGFVPRASIVDLSRPGAWALLQRLTSPVLTSRVIALLAPGEAETAALLAGAMATLHRPLDPEAVLTWLARFKQQEEWLRHHNDVFEHDRAPLPPSLLEGILATIGHEIRNPLAAALANMEVLRNPRALLQLSIDERTSALDDTAMALQRIQDVLATVSGLVKGAPPALERVVLHAVTGRALAQFKQHPAQLELAGDERLEGWANPALLEQVISNLVQNALAATQHLPDAHVLVRIYPAGDEVRISVRDNGPGVPPSLRDKIFEPFVTAKGERGTGIGLVLVRHAVERMGGRLTLGPSEHGAVFRVRLRAP